MFTYFHISSRLGFPRLSGCFWECDILSLGICKHLGGSTIRLHRAGIVDAVEAPKVGFLRKQKHAQQKVSRNESRIELQVENTTKMHSKTSPTHLEGSRGPNSDPKISDSPPLQPTILHPRARRSCGTFVLRASDPNYTCIGSS